MPHPPAFLTRGVFLLVLSLMLAGGVSAHGLPDFTELARDNTASVVNISTTQTVSTQGHGLPPEWEIPGLPEDHPFKDFFRRFFGEEGEAPREYDARSLGSGVIISEDGYILSNYHVVESADEIIVRLTDRRELEAEIVGTDKRSDLALLRVEAEGLPTARIGRSADVEVGEWVLAIGSPFGFEASVTAGVVSAKGRSLPRENYVPFIQTDVAINPGNSGGPLFNLDGEVVGINSQIFSRTGGYMGVSFAIPIDVAMEVAEQLKEEGRVTRGWLGVRIQDVTRELADSFGMERPRGALVAEVLDDSPAERAGLRVGDVIVEYDGREVEASSALPPMVGRTRIERRVPVVIVRQGERKTLKVEIGELPSEKALRGAEGGGADRDEGGRDEGAGALRGLGLRVSPLGDDARERLGVPPDRGVRVDEVTGGAARAAGLRRGDVILRVDTQPVETVDDLRRVVEAQPAGRLVPVLVQRREGPRFLALRVPE